MSTGKSSARFLIENGRITRINRLAKVSFLTVYADTGGGVTQYIDVTDFALPDTVGEGESVTVSGDVSMRKPQQPGGRWAIQLIARKWQSGKEELTPAMPTQRPSGTHEEAPPVDDSDIPF